MTIGISARNARRFWLTTLTVFLAIEVRSCWIERRKLHVAYEGEALHVSWQSPRDFIDATMEITDGSGVHVSIPLGIYQMGHFTYCQPIIGNVNVRLTTYLKDSAVPLVETARLEGQVKPKPAPIR
jgi:hypothetical protein